MLKFLTQPYPFDISNKSNWRRNALIGLFVASFLIIFQPFGTNNWHDEYKIIKLAGYGIFAFLVPSVIFAIQLKLQQPEVIEEHWTVAKEIALMLLIILGITLCNMLYSNVLSISNFDISSFVSFFFIVFIVAIFPIGAGILLRFNHFQQHNQKEAAVLAQNVQDYQQQNPIQDSKLIQNLTKLRYWQKTKKTLSR
jgi:glucan phosphoethanolaminetransferase (alkaline phosphatase superfamily)